MPDEQQIEKTAAEVVAEMDVTEQAELLASGDTLVTAEELHSASGTDGDEEWDPALRDPEATRQMTPAEAGLDEPPEPFSTGDVYESPFKDNDDLVAQAAAALKRGREEGLADDAKPQVKQSLPARGEESLDG